MFISVIIWYKDMNSMNYINILIRECPVSLPHALRIYLQLLLASVSFCMASSFGISRSASCRCCSFSRCRPS